MGIVAILLVLCGAVLADDRPAGPANLALNRPATASSVENDEHNAARADDGDARTSWRADDEPEGGPEWWQVDLGSSFDLTVGQICWPYDGKNYRYRVEGSVDGKGWQILSDQARSTSRAQVQNLKFERAGPVRYVRVTITGFDDGCWASISEVRLYGVRHEAGDGHRKLDK